MTIARPLDRNYTAQGWERICSAIRSIKPYYERHHAGGSLHIALDDGNMEADNVLWCLKEADKQGDREGAELCLILLDMSIDERYELYERYAEYAA